MSGIARDNAIIPFPHDTDMTEKKGYFVKIDNGKILLPTAAADHTPGVIVTGDEVESAVALRAGSKGTVYVKLSATPGTVVTGTYLTNSGDGSSKAVTATEEKVAMALEPGKANELIEAVLIPPSAK